MQLVYYSFILKIYCEKQERSKIDILKKLLFSAALTFTLKYVINMDEVMPSCSPVHYHLLHIFLGM